MYSTSMYITRRSRCILCVYIYTHVSIYEAHVAESTRTEESLMKIKDKFVTESAAMKHFVEDRLAGVGSPARCAAWGRARRVWKAFFLCVCTSKESWKENKHIVGPPQKRHAQMSVTKNHPPFGWS